MIYIPQLEINVRADIAPTVSHLRKDEEENQERDGVMT